MACAAQRCRFRKKIPDETTSLITHPQDGMKVKASHAVQISGVAWAGEADITAVEISDDAGRTWQQTQLGRDQSKYAWRLWQYVWRPAQPGEYTLMARASDNKGRTQPDDPGWNPSGYLWNGIQRVRVHVEVKNVLGLCVAVGGTIISAPGFCRVAETLDDLAAELKR
jgi:hypothetical protein